MAGQAAVTYSFDRADRLTGITQWTASVSLTYDAAGHLTGLTYRLGGTVLGNLTYGYDGAGSRIQVGGTWARTGLPQPVTSASYDAANQLLTWGPQALTYDANGNLTGDGARSYVWDARNRLASMSGPGLSATFQYDPLGRRQTKTINGGSTAFLYDGLTPVQELSGGVPSATLLTGLGLDEYFTRADAAGTQTLLPDALGSTHALTDDTGTLQTEYTYEPFGATSSSGEPTGNAFQYTGRENDGTGLYYYRARYYSPQWQRFLREDPLEFAGGDLNLYAYAAGNPVSFTDPLGLWTVSLGPRVGVSGLGFAAGGGMSLNVGYSAQEGFSLSLTGTAAAGASATGAPIGGSFGGQVDVSNAASVEGLTGTFIEGGRSFGRPGAGGFVSPDGSVYGGSASWGSPRPLFGKTTPGSAAGGSDTSAIIQIDRNGIHIGRRNGESLIDIPIPGIWIPGWPTEGPGDGGAGASGGSGGGSGGFPPPPGPAGGGPTPGKLGCRKC